MSEQKKPPPGLTDDGHKVLLCDFLNEGKIQQECYCMIMQLSCSCRNRHLQAWQQFLNPRSKTQKCWLPLPSDILPFQQIASEHLNHILPTSWPG